MLKMAGDNKIFLVLSALFLCFAQGHSSISDSGQSNGVKPVQQCWPDEAVYKDFPSCDSECQCLFSSPQGRIYSPFSTRPEGDKKFHNIHVHHSDYLMITVQREFMNFDVHVGVGTIESVSNITNDLLVASITSEDDFAGKEFLKVPIIGDSAFIIFVQKEEEMPAENWYADYESFSMQTESELITHKDPTMVEPPLGPDGADYQLATTKTWKLGTQQQEQQGNTYWRIKVLSLDFGNLDTLVFGSGESSGDMSDPKSTTIDSTWVGKSFLIPGPSAYITFQSTVHVVPTMGFSLLVEQVDSGDQHHPGTSCDWTGCNYTAWFGVIDLKSPQLGPGNLTFRIRGPENSMVMIRFQKTVTSTGEGSEQSSILEPGDKVSIGYGGPPSGSPSKETLRTWFKTFSHLIQVGPNLVQIPVPYDNAWIFVSEKGEEPEYEIAYQIIPAVKGEEIIEEEGPVELLPPPDNTPNASQVLNYASNAKWLWRLQPSGNSPDTRWKIKVKNFHLDEDGKDFLEFGKGERPGSDENVVLKAFGIMDSREVIIDAPLAYIYFESNLHVNPMPGFELSVERTYINQNDVHENFNARAPVVPKQAVECFPPSELPEEPDCSAEDCQCTYTAKESWVYVPMYGDTGLCDNTGRNCAKRYQNINVTNADFLMLYFNEDTFWVNNNETGVPEVNMTKNVVMFGSGNLEKFQANMPETTVIQFQSSSDFGPTGEIKVPIIGNLAFGNYLYFEDGGWEDNTKAKYRYESFAMNYTDTQNMTGEGPYSISSPMNGNDYSFATQVSWQFQGKPGHYWEIKEIYVDIERSRDILVAGPGDMPTSFGVADIWPAIFATSNDLSQAKPRTITIDSHKAYVVFKSTIHISPRRGFSLQVRRLGEEMLSTTPEPNVTDVTPAPTPAIPAGASLEKSFLLQELPFTMDDLQGNATAAERFRLKLVRAIVETCNEYSNFTHLSLQEPVARKHVQLKVTHCGSCFDKKKCAQVTFRVTVANTDGYYAFTSEVLSNMLSSPFFKKFFDRRVESKSQLNLHCDFVWWYWTLAGVGLFAILIAVGAWRISEKGKKVKKSKIVASSDSEYFKKETTEPFSTRFGGVMEGFGGGAHLNPSYVPNYDDEDETVLYDGEEVMPRLRPGSGINGDDRLVERI